MRVCLGVVMPTKRAEPSSDEEECQPGATPVEIACLCQPVRSKIYYTYMLLSPGQAQAIFGEPVWVAIHVSSSIHGCDVLEPPVCSLSDVCSQSSSGNLFAHDGLDGKFFPWPCDAQSPFSCTCKTSGSHWRQMMD